MALAYKSLPQVNTTNSKDAPTGAKVERRVRVFEGIEKSVRFTVQRAHEAFAGVSARKK